MPAVLFRDRAEAGCILADRLRKIVRDQDVLVLALPRGGVPVGFEIARALDCDLDVCLVRKLGVPGHEEIAMGAIASGGIRVLNRSLIEHLRISEAAIEEATERENREVYRRESLYRKGLPRIRVADRTVVLVDDGLATGATMLAAVRVLAMQDPEKIVVGIPVAAPETCERFQKYVDHMLCLATPKTFQAVGSWYGDFSQVADEEVRDLLERASRMRNSRMQDSRMQDSRMASQAND
jgi:putative phosphoribosyl transferase